MVMNIIFSLSIEIDFFMSANTPRKKYINTHRGIFDCQQNTHKEVFLSTNT
jgi:hypothetical protein